MNKWTRFFIFALIMVITLMTMIYVFSPQLTRWIFVQKLPEQWQLKSFSMDHPSWHQISINELKIITDAFSQQTLELEGALIKVDWFSQSIRSVEVNRIGGTASIESIHHRQGSFKSDTTDGSTSKNAAEAFSLPEVFIKQLDVRLTAKNEKVKISGSMQTLNGHFSGHINLASSSGDVLDLNIKQRDQSFDMNGTLSIDSVSYWLKLFASLGFEEVFIYRLLTGELDGKIAGDLQVRFILLDNESQLSDWSFSLGDYALQLDSLESKVEFSDFSYSRDDVKASNFTTLANIQFKDNRWQAKVGKTRLSLKAISSISWLSKKELNVSSNNFLIAYEDSGLQLQGYLNLDKQKIEINSRGYLGQGTSTKHSIAISLSDLNDAWTPHLKAVSIGQVKGTIDFELVHQDDSWLINSAKANTWVLKDISYQGLIHANLPELLVSVKLPAELEFSSLDISELQLKGQGLNVQSESWSTWGQVDFKSTIGVKPGYWDIDVQVLPTQVDLVSKDLLLTGTELKPKFSSSFKFYSATQKAQGKLELDGDIYSVKPLLTKLLPKHKKMIKELIVNDVPKLNSNVNLYYQPSKGFELQGEHSFTVAGIGLGQLYSKSLQLSLHWDEKQPWSRARALSHFDLSYGDIDQQHHKVRFDVQMTPEFQFKGLDISSRMFSGEARIVGNPEFKSWSDSSGEIEIKNLELEKISRVLASEDLRFSGRLSGKVPFSVVQQQLHFTNGLLKSEQGMVQYVPGGIKKVLTKETMSDIASIALQNFHYHLLTAKLNKGGPCGFDFDIRLEGRNPDLGDGAQQNFNIKYQPESNVNLYYLMLLGDSFIKELKRDTLHSACVN